VARGVDWKVSVAPDFWDECGLRLKRLMFGTIAIHWAEK
jgi:hypothetical protein